MILHTAVIYMYVYTEIYTIQKGFEKQKLSENMEK